MKIDMGRMVEVYFRQFKALHKGCGVKWLAERLNCDRRNIYDIFRRPTIDTQLLTQISIALNHNFFKDIASEIDARINETQPGRTPGFHFMALAA